ncbi:MAG TPA: hypothetical protein VMF69_14675 [Gemmataceae bacterium]|nr:hypothetical protein [Gemmataceae bacterium]
MPSFHLTTFRSDATPPLGHPLCGGWIEPVRGIDDRLRSLGIVLLGADAPVVLCAVDWCGLRNEANRAWRQALAQAANTTPERVAIHCVHPHNAPFADVEAERLLQTVHGPPSLDLSFFDRVVQQSADALREALKKTMPFSHIRTGQARVEQVASNRRIIGADGKIRFTRYSATKDAKIRAEPEGLIDPWLRTLSFWQDEKPLAALSYYAVHPMSYYGDGRVSADFCGLARQKRQDEDANVFQMYFNGCAGNITAGKYNDGSKANRPLLRDRMYTALKAAWKATKRHPLTAWQWRVEPIRLPPRREKSFGEEESRKVLGDAQAVKARRGNAAFQLAWLKRLERPIELTCLDLGKAMVLHLPGEPFVEYQLKAQELRKDAFVFVAGYGDGGPGYIPTDKAYLEGGYEPTVALAAPSEKRLTEVIAKVLKARK